MKKIYSFKSLPSPLKIPSQNKPALLCHLHVKISSSQRLSAENQFLDLLKNIHTIEPTIQQFQACSSLPWDSGNSSYQASSLFYQCPWESAEADNPENSINKRLRQQSSFTGATVTGGDVTALGWGKVRLCRGICPQSRQGSTGCSKEFTVFTWQVSPPFLYSNHILNLRAVRIHQCSFLLVNFFSPSGEVIFWQ